MLKKIALSITVSSFALVVSSACAQVTANQTTEPDAGLGDIIVTAERSSTDLQRTPIAISVLGAEALQQRRVVDLKDIATQAPGFTFSPNLKTQITLSLRGAASLDDSPGTDQAVAIFVDEIYIGQGAAFAFDLFDLERIEVLKGPQGTIFGKNVVGGAINIITRNPTNEPYVLAEATYGNFGRLDGRVSVSGPLVEDKLSALVSFSSRNSDGSVYNAFTRNRLEQDNQQGLRAKLKWTPASDFEALLAVDYARDKSRGIAEFFFGPSEPAAGPNPVLGSTSQTYQNTDGYYDRKIYGGSLRMNYTASTALELTSITGYRASQHHTQVDADATSLPLLEFVDSGNELIPAAGIQSLHDISQFSQEFRATGETGSLKYIAGVYYYHSRYSKIETLFENGAPGSLFGSILGIVNETEILGQAITTDSYAAFAQGTYSFTEALRLSAGLRYTREKKQGRTYCVDPGAQCTELYDVPVGKTWSALTPKVTLDADLGPTTLAYATVSRGFKSGGFVSGVPTGAETVDPFDPEFAWNYEIGLKTRFFNNRLQVNIAAFHVKYTDLQVRQFAQNGSTLVANAGSARVNGIEVDIRAKPLRAFELFGSFSYLDGKYNELNIAGVDNSGKQMIYTPKHSLTLGAEYTADFGDSGSFVFASDILNQARIYYTPDNNPEKSGKFSNIWNASVTYQLPGDKWSVQFWGKNILNEQTRTVVNDFGNVLTIAAGDLFSGGAGYSGRYNERATYGLTARFKL